MARIRTIKPEFWTDEELSALPEATHLLAAALLNHADDEGFFKAHPLLIKAACCPLREPSVSIQESLLSLQFINYIELGATDDGKQYGRIVKFAEHQRVNRATPSKISKLGIAFGSPEPNHGGLIEPSPLEGKGKEQGRDQGKEIQTASSSSEPTEKKPGKRPIPKDFAISEEIRAFGNNDLGLSKPEIDASFSYFLDYCRSKGGSPYADYDAALRNCLKADWGGVINRMRFRARRAGPSERLATAGANESFGEM